MVPLNYKYVMLFFRYRSGHPLDDLTAPLYTFFPFGTQKVRGSDISYILYASFHSVISLLL
jgi:hypothetical protein